MTSKEKAKKLHEIADALEEWGKYNEKVTNAAELDTPEAKQIIRKAMTLLVDNLALLNECKNKYGLHGLLQQCFANIGQAASWSKTKDLGDCRGWCQEFTKRPLWEEERRSFADECVRYANEVGKETKQDTKDSGDTYNINAEHVSLGDKAQHAGNDINTITPEQEKENKPCYKKIWAWIIGAIILFAAIATILILLFGDNILGRISKEFKSNKPAIEQSDIPKTEAKTIKEAETEKQIQPKIIQQTMEDSPGGTQVAGDLYISETENTLHKPIVVVSATVEVKITSDWDFNGTVANTKAYLVFVKDDKPLLITSSIGYTARQTGNNEVVYKVKLDMDAKDSAVGKPASFLKDAEYIQIEFGRMPSDSCVLEGDAICIINNSVRLKFSIPPQKLVNNRIFIRNLSESLQVLNEPSM